MAEGRGSMMEDENNESVGAFYCLPFDCLVSVCEHLGPRDLCRFGATCKVAEFLVPQAGEAICVGVGVGIHCYLTEHFLANKFEVALNRRGASCS